MKSAVWPVVAVVAIVVALAAVLLRGDGKRESELTGAAAAVAKHVKKRVRLVYAHGGKRMVIEGRVTEVSRETVKIKSASGKVVRVRRAEIWDVAPAAAAREASSEDMRLSLKIEANERLAVAGLRMIATGQNTWRRNDWDNNGLLDYTRQYRNLYYQLDMAGRPLAIIPKQFADASGGASCRGYFFADLTANWQTGPYNWQYEFGICAWPAKYGITGRHTFVISAEGTVYQRDMGIASGPVNVFPNVGIGWQLAH